MKYPLNKLELLAVMRSVELFKNYVYGTKVGIFSDHKALHSVLSANKRNKQFSSRLTRWVDRLLPYDINFVHTPGRTLRISRHPFHCNRTSIKSVEMFEDWFTINVVDEFTKGIDQTLLAKRNGSIKTRDVYSGKRKTC